MHTGFSDECTLPVRCVCKLDVYIQQYDSILHVVGVSNGCCLSTSVFCNVSGIRFIAAPAALTVSPRREHGVVEMSVLTREARGLCAERRGFPICLTRIENTGVVV